MVDFEAFRGTFKDGPIFLQRFSGLLRGMIVQGVRLRGLPDKGIVRIAPALKGEEVEVCFTEAEYVSLCELASSSFDNDLASLLSALIQREAPIRPALPFVPKLDGLQGGVIQVKQFRRTRIPAFLFSKLRPFVTKYDSIRTMIDLPLNDDFDGVPVRDEAVYVMLSKDEIRALDTLRAEMSSFGKPSRPDVLRECFHETCDLKWLSQNERIDTFNLSLDRYRKESAEQREEIRTARRRIKKYKRQRDLQACWSIEVMEHITVYMAEMMRAGLKEPDEQTMKLGPEIERKWEEGDFDMPTIYEPEILKEYDALQKMSAKARKRWHEAFKTDMERILTLARTPSKKDLN